MLITLNETSLTKNTFLIPHDSKYSKIWKIFNITTSTLNTHYDYIFSRINFNQRQALSIFD